MKIEFEFPEACHRCGAKMALPTKRKKGKNTIIERRCTGETPHLERLTLQTTFSEDDREEIMELVIDENY